MTGILTAVYLLAICLWVGAMVFFTFVAAPNIFKSLDHERASAVVVPIVASHNLLGYVCSFVGLTCLAVLWQIDETSSVVNWFKMLLGMLVLLAFMDRWLSPRLRELGEALAKKESETLQTRFDAFTRLAVLLHYSLVGFGVLLVVFTSLRLTYY